MTSTKARPVMPPMMPPTNTGVGGRPVASTPLLPLPPPAPPAAEPLVGGTAASVGAPEPPPKPAPPVDDRVPTWDEKSDEPSDVAEAVELLVVVVVDDEDDVRLELDSVVEDVVELDHVDSEDDKSSTEKLDVVGLVVGSKADVLVAEEVSVRPVELAEQPKVAGQPLFLLSSRGEEPTGGACQALGGGGLRFRARGRY